MIPNRWYPILESQKLKKRPVGLRRLGERLVVWRDGDGTAKALPAACPHRGADLATGRIMDGEIACPYHGFQFTGDGTCTHVPCSGADAKIPHGLHMTPYRVEERHGLVWLWWGDAANETPIPYFEEVGSDLRCSSEASYILPYHYSRMVETNLDIHHTPFVHGSVIPVGQRVANFSARLVGDRIYTKGELIKDDRSDGMAFRADMIFPCLGFIELASKFWIVVSATPVDDTHSWMWFRYYQGRTNVPLLRKFIPWFSVLTELRLVQPQDWRLFEGLAPGSVDEVNYHLVEADQGIALYRGRRRQLLSQPNLAEAS